MERESSFNQSHFDQTHFNQTHDELRFQVSLLRLVYHGSLDGGPNLEAGNESTGVKEGSRQAAEQSSREEVPQYVSRQIAKIEQLIAH